MAETLKLIHITDLHGNLSKYEKLFTFIRNHQLDAVLFGGDLMPHAFFKHKNIHDFANDYIFKNLLSIQKELKENCPEFIVILGNDDARFEESKFIEAEKKSIIKYIHNKKTEVKGYDIYGYSFIPPTPFRLKDWEKYDVSRYVDPGCVHPYEGSRTVNPDYDPEWDNIKNDIPKLIKNNDLSKAIFLFHSPPYNTQLDIADLEGQYIDHVPLDPHVGSIAIKEFIESSQPLITFHGHVHEASQLSGKWFEQIGRTIICNGAFKGNDLSIINVKINQKIEINRILL